MKLWLDDLRPAPDGWTHAHSVDESTLIIMACSPDKFEDASLDNDLGEYSQYGGDGYKLLDWMRENDAWPKNKPTVHSMNPVRAQTMKDDIERYWHE